MRRASHPLLEPCWDADADILVGTSGFSFADWVGPFYPHGFGARDMLPYYSHRFAAVEINSTYYRIPPPRTFSGMANRVPARFRFTVKAHGSMTHARRLDPGIVSAFVAGLEPLRETGQLAGVLAQLPWSCRATPAHRAHLAALRRAIPDTPLFVEFRHASWARPETWCFLRDHGLGYAVVDEPRLKGLMPPVARLTGTVGYIRLHGRNARCWWGHSGWERYDYRYTRAELGAWAAVARRLAEQAEQVFVFFNNCHAGNAVLNAIDLGRELAAADRSLVAPASGSPGGGTACHS
ncbi:MAG: DUF72 domain-containing protein [Candidatus Eiseniibacteriota bacterium]|jgi:uncharacterized protein YecE (DUF72 family)